VRRPNAPNGQAIGWPSSATLVTLEPVSQPDITITRTDVRDESTLRAGYDVWRDAVLDADPDDPVPMFPEILAWAQAPEVSKRREYALMRAGEVPVGSYQLSMPLLDNLGLVEIDLGIHPAYQGRGHGRTLLEHALARCAELGRHQVLGAVTEPSTEGQTNRAMRFAAAAGAHRALGDLRRTLDLTTLDRERLAALRQQAEAASPGYELVHWTGRCPDELVDGYAALVARMSTDAPMGDLGIEPEKWDAARVREVEDVVRAQGRVRIATAARRKADGELVAMTDIAVTEHDPTNAFQWDTLVRKEDRGHRLGMRVKLANLDRLVQQAPAAKRVHTWNADVNSWMIAINEAMGFRPVDAWVSWQQEV
jgi:GNAT superfamily N-acetyltransferase